MAQELTGLGKLAQLSPVASIVLAIAMLMTGFIGRSAVGTQAVQSNTQRITDLAKQVESLQLQIAQSQVVATEVKHVNEKTDTLNANVNRLADELHSWQREERRYHQH